MIKLRKYLKAGQFNEQAEESFSFVLEFGFFGPERGDDWIAYSTGELGLEVAFDDRDGYVVTIVRSFFADRSPTAEINCLYVSAGLGPAQDIRGVARTRRQLKIAMESHAAALRKLLPVLKGPRGVDLLLECHGR